MAVAPQIDQPRQVRPGEALDTTRLELYLRDRFPDPTGPLVVEQFPAGYSNLTYLVRWGNREMVLRRPPFGSRVKTAHDMGREFRVLSQLSPVYPLAPQPFAYCEDENVLGAPFYLMQRRQGIVLRRDVPPGAVLDADCLGRLSCTFIDQLANLHRLDYKAAGLADFGRPAGYVQRQIAGWTRRYQTARIEAEPAMDRVADWLERHLPDEQPAALIHNDYKYDNLMLDAQDITRVVAVLDWEMATLGDPLMDLGVTLAYWVNPDDPPVRQATAFGPTNRAGSMTRRDLVERYASAVGRELPDMCFYYVYGLFKIAVIVQQIYARYARGHTRDQRFEELNRMVTVLAETAAAAAQSQTI